jgi:hypothetical protein
LFRSLFAPLLFSAKTFNHGTISFFTLAWDRLYALMAGAKFCVDDKFIRDRPVEVAQVGEQCASLIGKFREITFKPEPAAYGGRCFFLM